MNRLNRLTGQLDALFDRFLDGALWPLLAVLALIIYIQGVTS